MSQRKEFRFLPTFDAASTTWDLEDAVVGVAKSLAADATTFAAVDVVERFRHHVFDDVDAAKSDANDELGRRRWLLLTTQTPPTQLAPQQPSPLHRIY